MPPTEPAPHLDVVECSLFGPGIGESVVIHVGRGDWIIVDSCRDRDSRRPAALEYLDSLGVEPAAVRLVVATHWHDDHIDGLSEVVASCQQARFVCSVALRAEEFRVLVTTGHDGFVERSGVREFGQILQRLNERRRRGHALNFGWAIENSVLFRDESPGALMSEVWALSPSADAVTRSKRGLAKLLPQIGQSKRAVADLPANDLAVALLVRSGAVSLLLGSDLEHSGWKIIMESPVRPPALSQTFKVPHHGSEGADHAGVWTSLLEPLPTALVTPYSPSRLPSEADLSRLRSRAGAVYVTAPSIGSTPRSRKGSVEKMMRQATRDRTTAEAGFGQVRIRMPQDGSSPASVETIGAAFRSQSTS